MGQTIEILFVSISYLCGVNNLKQFKDFIYKDASIYLKRKKDKFDQL